MIIGCIENIPLNPTSVLVTYAILHYLILYYVNIMLYSETCQVDHLHLVTTYRC